MNGVYKRLSREDFVNLIYVQLDENDKRYFSEWMQRVNWSLWVLATRARAERGWQ